MISPADLLATDALLSKQGAVSDKARLDMSMATLPSNVKAAHGMVDRYVEVEI